MRMRPRADAGLHGFTQGSKVAGCSFLSKSIKKNEKGGFDGIPVPILCLCGARRSYRLVLEYANTFIRYCQSVGTVGGPSSLGILYEKLYSQGCRCYKRTYSVSKEEEEGPAISSPTASPVQEEEEGDTTDPPETEPDNDETTPPVTVELTGNDSAVSLSIVSSLLLTTTSGLALFY
jgi:hypothetical protein